MGQWISRELEPPEFSVHETPEKNPEKNPDENRSEVEDGLPSRMKVYFSIEKNIFLYKIILYMT